MPKRVSRVRTGFLAPFAPPLQQATIQGLPFTTDQTHGDLMIFPGAPHCFVHKRRVHLGQSGKWVVTASATAGRHRRSSATATLRIPEVRAPCTADYDFYAPDPIGLDAEQQS